MPFHGIFSLIFLVLVTVGIVVAIRSILGAGRYPKPGHDRSTALELLEERYAKGEIQREEYLQKRRDLTG
jgi:putative membrane protein